MARWRVMLVGCGYIAPFHLAAWRGLNNVEVIAVCDLDEKKARERADTFGVERVLTDYETAIRELEPDVVDVATPPATHPEIIEAAAAGGAHVLCQKPFAESLREADRMITTCARAGVRLMVNENLRWSRVYRELRALLDQGTLGEPYYLQIIRDRLFLGKPLFPDQPFIRDMPRAMLYEVGIHFVDCVRFLLGEIESVHCRMRRINPQMRGEDVIVLSLNLVGGQVGIVKADWCSRQRNDAIAESIRLSGTEGTVVVSDDGRMSLLLNDGRTIEQGTFDETYLEGQAFPRAHAHFIRGLETGEPFETDGRDNRRTLAAVLAGYESAERQAVVRPDGGES
ncbi:MAG: hypothetical protein CMJ84_15885 [Planctomycetes bacterium]|nr:hypothetical protein [Planctomycetota bacterium]